MSQFPAMQKLQGENPWNEFHNLDVTKDTIKQLLADGTPDWVKRPEEYRNYAREAFLAEKEISDSMVKQYRLPNQDILSHRASRMVRPMATRAFVQKLRDHGVQCFTIQVQAGIPTVGLWAMSKLRANPIYITYCQIPAMYEWSVAHIDEHGLAAGEDYRGWRTVLSQLIIKEVLTEQKAHQIFGEPSGEASVIYKETLWKFRNGIGRGPAVVLPVEL